MNIAWLRDVDEVLGTHTLVPEDLEEAVTEAAEECLGECIFIEQGQTPPRSSAHWHHFRATCTEISEAWIGILDRAIRADWDEPQPCSCLPTAIGHALLIVVLSPGQLRPGQILHATDKLRTVAKTRPNLGVAGTSLPPGENPPFQRPEHLRIARRTRLTMRPRTKGQDLGHTPSAAPESPGHLGRVNTSRYEPAYPPLDRPQVCVAGYCLRFHHYSTISRTTRTQFVSSKRLGEFGRDGPDSAREGHCVEVRAGRAGPPILGDTACK